MLQQRQSAFTARMQLEQSLGRAPTTAEVAARIGVDEKQVELLDRAVLGQQSLDTELVSQAKAPAVMCVLLLGSRLSPMLAPQTPQRDGTASLGDTLAAKPDTAAAEDVDAGMLLVEVKALMRTLAPKERQVLSLYYGLV